MSQDQREHETCDRDGSDKYLRPGISLPARIYADHVRFSRLTI